MAGGETSPRTVSITSELDGNSAARRRLPSLWDRNSDDKIKQTIFRPAVEDRSLGATTQGINQSANEGSSSSQKLTNPIEGPNIAHASASTFENHKLYHERNGITRVQHNVKGTSSFNVRRDSRKDNQQNSHVETSTSKMSSEASNYDRQPYCFMLDSDEELSISISDTPDHVDHGKHQKAHNHVDKTSVLDSYYFDVYGNVVQEMRRRPSFEIQALSGHQDPSRPANHVQLLVTYHVNPEASDDRPLAKTVADRPSSHTLPNGLKVKSTMDATNSSLNAVTPDGVYDNLNASITDDKDDSMLSFPSFYSGRSQTLPQKSRTTKLELQRNHSVSHVNEQYDPNSPQITMDYVDHVMAAASASSCSSTPRHKTTTPKCKLSESSRSSLSFCGVGYDDDEVFSSERSSTTLAGSSTPTHSVLSEYFNKRKKLSSSGANSSVDSNGNPDSLTTSFHSTYGDGRAAFDVSSPESDKDKLYGEFKFAEQYDNEILRVEVLQDALCTQRSCSSCANSVDHNSNHLDLASQVGRVANGHRLANDRLATFTSEKPPLGNGRINLHSSSDEMDIENYITPERQLVLDDIKWLEYQLQMVSCWRLYR